MQAFAVAIGCFVILVSAPASPEKTAKRMEMADRSMQTGAGWIVRKFHQNAGPSVARAVTQKVPVQTAAAKKNVTKKTAPAVAKSEPAEVQAADRRVSGQISAVERQLTLEDKRLQTVFAKLEKMRREALEREDSKALKRLEAMEKREIQIYEKRVNRIIAALNSIGDAGNVRSGKAR